MSKIRLLLILFTTLDSCTNQLTNITENMESRSFLQDSLYRDTLTSEYNDILKAILDTDSNTLVFNDERGRAAYLQHYFVQNHISKTIDYNEPEIPHKVYYENLKVLFNDWSKDSTAIIKQIALSDTIFVNKMLRDRYYGNPDVLNIQAQLPYYSFYRPLLSADRKRAVVYMNFECPLCGNGVEYLLKKDGSKWIIIQIRNTWIS